MLISAAYSVSGIGLISPKLGQITALNFSDSSKLIRMGENA